MKKLNFKYFFLLPAVLAFLASCSKQQVEDVHYQPVSEVGKAVGEKLRAVASHHQVVAITHLPQSAVFGERHLVVSKSVSSGRTRTEIRDVTGEDRVAEIARMLGGAKLTSVVTRHARELLAIASR